MKEKLEKKIDKMSYRTLRVISIITLLLLFSSCSLTTKVDQIVEIEVVYIPEGEAHGFVMSPHTFTGWWVYGEGQHIFKDEQTLDEYDLVFPNENMVELVELYISVCEMEYFPMECQMSGILSGSILSVEEFEILYIQGCGE
jgi:hypothetical protein